MSEAMSTMLGSGSRLVPSLLAAASGLTAAAVVGAASYAMFGAGSVGAPQSARAATLRYAHLLHVSDTKSLSQVVCAGTDPQLAALAGVTWRLDPGQLDTHATAFTLASADGARHLRVQAAKVRTGWCISAVQAS